ncbi:MAG: PTS transporter subunit EIIB [Clostridium sp.]|nr:MAG: PTS transporter subunit EIIB [Clostridium sp.]
MFLALGGIDNLIGVGVENSRLKLSVKDLSLVDLNKIKEFSDKGVFVTGNTIKTLFKFESEKIAYELKKLI